MEIQLKNKDYGKKYWDVKQTQLTNNFFRIVSLKSLIDRK